MDTSQRLQRARKSSGKASISKTSSSSNLRESSIDSLASVSNDSFSNQDINLDKDRVSRELQSLSFANPGRKNAEISTTRLKRREITQKSDGKPPQYDNKGQLTYDGHLFKRICDCFRESCNGCFSKCHKCDSRKCGPICQIGRKFIPFKTVVQGSGGKAWKNPQISDSLMNKIEADFQSQSEDSDSD